MKRVLTVYLIAIAIFAYLVFLTRPTIAFDFAGIYFLVFVSALIGFFISPIKDNYGDLKFLHPSNIFGWIAVGSIVSMLLFWFFGTSGFFHWRQYEQMLGEVETGVFTSDLEPISTEQMRIIDEESVIKIGDKLLGADPSLGSRAEHGDYTLQAVDQKLYWVAPILHSGFFKWNRNKTQGTPGYVMVSATNSSDAKLVEQIDGKDLHIVYQPNAFFSYDLKRHIRRAGYRSLGLSEFRFELDDAHNPFWITSLYSHQIGFSGMQIEGVLVVNPETGEVTEYSVEDAPSWIDRIYPASMVGEQIEDQGRLVHGIWNFSGRDKLIPTHTPTLVYGGDNKCYFYTGITSTGSDEGTIGFMLIDSRTKVAKKYLEAGATETSAVQSAEGTVQQMEYRASEPIMYNVEGVPTYVSSLKDKEGIVRMVAFISVRDYTMVGKGITPRDALRDYKSVLSNSGNATVPGFTSTEVKTTATVERFSSDVVSGVTDYYIILDGMEDKQFRVRSAVSIEIPLTREGDTISITFDDAGSEVVDITSFDNLSLNFSKSTEQIEKEEYFTSVDSIQKTAAKVESADEKWKKMSEEEKLKLMQK